MIRYVWIVLFSIALAFSATAQQVNTEATTSYEFVPNRGQFHPLAKYRAVVPYGNVYLESQSIVYDLIDPDAYDKAQDYRHHHPAQSLKSNIKRHAVRFWFSRNGTVPKHRPLNVLPHYYNYFIGNDASRWASAVHPSKVVEYQQLMPGIDLQVLGQNGLKYQWIVDHPTPEKLKQISMTIDGADSVALVNGELIIHTSVGQLTDAKPYVYQWVNGNLREIECAYVLTDTVVSFQFLDDVHPMFPVVIDPKLIFSTYSGSVGDNFGFTATYDSRGNLYAGGIVSEGLNFTYPVTTGAFDTTWNGGTGLAPANLECDISISKYDSAGTKLLWATYLGGRGDEYPHSLVVDKNDDLIVLGTTFSDNFAYYNGFDATKEGSNNSDIIVAKFSADGTELIGSTYMGGSKNDGLNLNSPLKKFYADDFRGDVITDDDGTIYVATVTQSDTVPMVNATKGQLDGNFDGLIFALNDDLSTLLWSTYLGGRGADALYSIKLDKNNHLYVGGGTNSSDLPTSDTAFNKTHNGGIDGWLARFTLETKQLQQLTYWGTPSYDQIYFIDIDTRNNIFATGQTEGSIAKSPNTYGLSNRGQFIFKMDSALNAVEFKTTFGNTVNAPNLAPSAFLVDVCDHIYFSGWGSFDYGLNSGSTINLPVTSDAEQAQTDSNDFYIIVLDKDASALLYATYFGGFLTGDHVDGGTSRFDKRGVIYQSVCSSCPPSRRGGLTKEISDFPTSPGAVFPTNPSIRCSNASFKIDLQIKSAVIADFIADPIMGCSPLNVKFTNRSILGDSMIWFFGDGDTSTEINPTHFYALPGTYTVKLIVIDSNTCNISSEYERDIVVYQNSHAEFEAYYDVCSGQFEVVNLSENATTYRWDFGDGGRSTEEVPLYKYRSPGQYMIYLHVNEGSPCESVDSFLIDIKLYEEPKITLYNVFTPSEDDKNDCFQMDVTELGCLDYRLRIYNRWGEQVFETYNPDLCWNGRVQNQYHILPAGTYFYLLQLGNEEQDIEPISGLVELIR